MQIYTAAVPYMGALVFSGLISALLAIKVYKAFNYRRMRFSNYFIFIMLIMSFWSVSYAFEIGLMDIELKYFFARLEHIGTAFLPVAGFLFAAEYTGVCKAFVRKYEKAFFTLPLLAIFLMLTNSLHRMYFTSYTLNISEGFPLLALGHGPFFWGFYLYSLILIVLGVYLFFDHFVYLTAPYRAQAGIALTAACIPVLGNILHLADIGPFAFIDPTPFTFIITGLIIFWGITQHEFLNIITVARINVIKSISDGHIVSDADSILPSLLESKNLILEERLRKEFPYQVALSFAGEDRDLAEKLANLLKKRNITVFYDKDEQAKLWGIDLYQYFQSIYRDKAKFCVIFMSKAYSQKFWTRHELKQAQARAFKESQEYILPLKVDDTEIPGITETIGYIDLRKTSLKSIADLLENKLRNNSYELITEKPRQP